MENYGIYGKVVSQEKWVIDKQFDFCFGHRVWSQDLNTKFSLDSCLACRHLHGHQGLVKLFLSAHNLEKGMVTDFKHTNIFKKWLDDTLDHKFIIDINDPLFYDLCGHAVIDDRNIKSFDDIECEVDKNYGFATPKLTELREILDDYVVQGMMEFNEAKAVFEKYEGLIFVNFVPTSENLCKWWYEVASVMLNELNIKIESIEYWETPKSHCKYIPSESVII